ncbi:hypothetical protein AX17_002535 [Amanita inopinata Kibby_2008]|nr:hypothetical protein AX17_002535 [Amanita inopinata Kibby_2008]
MDSLPEGNPIVLQVRSTSVTNDEINLQGTLQINTPLGNIAVTIEGDDPRFLMPVEISSLSLYYKILEEQSDGTTERLQEGWSLNDKSKHPSLTSHILLSDPRSTGLISGGTQSSNSDPILDRYQHSRIDYDIALVCPLPPPKKGDPSPPKNPISVELMLFAYVSGPADGSYFYVGSSVKIPLTPETASCKNTYDMGTVAQVVPNTFENLIRYSPESVIVDLLAHLNLGPASDPPA